MSHFNIAASNRNNNGVRSVARVKRRKNVLYVTLHCALRYFQIACFQPRISLMESMTIKMTAGARFDAYVEVRLG
jgi:hypothetical protein